MKISDPMELADRQSELPRLLWVLRNGKGFGLYFVCCNAPAYRRELVDKIKAEYAQPILEFDLTGHDGEEYIDHRLLTWANDKPAGAPVFLYGLETLLPTRDEDRQFRTLQEINWRRNVYSQLNRNLVIWLPEYALTLLARTASDFYDWHSAVFEFPVPDSEKAGFVKQSMMEFMDGETHPANRMTLAEKKRWLSVLKGLLDETPKDSVEYAGLLNDMGRLHESFGQYQTAMLKYQESLDIFKKLNLQVDECAVINNISNIYNTLGNYTEALKILEYSLDVIHNIGYRSIEEATILNNLSQSSDGPVHYNQR
ncbi:MAG: tetratricopeptide repeat protein, partial [Candidatus Methylumidiphilus sp.]